jgi:hypothetical protein
MADMKVSEEVKGKIGNVIFTLNHVKDGKANRPIQSLRACVDVLLNQIESLAKANPGT